MHLRPANKNRLFLMGGFLRIKVEMWDMERLNVERWFLKVILKCSGSFQIHSYKKIHSDKTV